MQWVAVCPFNVKCRRDSIDKEEEVVAGENDEEEDKQLVPSLAGYVDEILR